MQNTKLELHFVIGIGRSGTTILTKMLNEYQDVHCMPEANFLSFFLHEFSNKKKFTTKDIDQIFTEIELYSYSHPWVGWEFDAENVKSYVLNIIEKKQKISYQELTKIIYKEFKVVGTDKSSANIIIDKNPSYTIFVNEISKAFSESKFIWIVRDYRANILSRKQSIFLKSPNIAYNAIRWKMYNKIAYSYYKKNPNKVILIKYENLVQDPSTFEKILLFLEINKTKKESEEIHSVDLEAFKVEEKYQERFRKKYSDLNKKLNNNRTFSWKEQLNYKEIEICDALCGKIANKIGYHQVTNISLIKKIGINISNILPVCLGYFDIFKDKLLFYFPIQFKLNRLKKKYIELGFIK